MSLSHWKSTSRSNIWSETLQKRQLQVKEFRTEQQHVSIRRCWTLWPRFQPSRADPAAIKSYLKDVCCCVASFQRRSEHPPITAHSAPQATHTHTQETQIWTDRAIRSTGNHMQRCLQTQSLTPAEVCVQQRYIILYVHTELLLINRRILYEEVGVRDDGSFERHHIRASL